MILVSVLLACTRPEPPPGTEPGPPTGPAGDSGTPASTGATGSTGTTGDTGEPELPVDCSLLVAPEDATYTVSSAIVTEEDFDFDGQGYLLTQRGSSDLQGIDRYGVSHAIASDVGADATGIRSVSSGDVVVAQPWTGEIRLVDPDTGGSLTLLGGLSNPNGLEAGEGDGMIYVTENTANGRVRMVDTATGDATVILQLDYGNGIALSPGDQTLYVASSASPFGGSTRIVAMDRDPQGGWDASTARVIYEHPEYVGSLTADACGNVYGVEFSTGRVFRLDPSTGAAEGFVDLSGFGSFSALHFSPGLGGWDVESLYVTSRAQLYEIPTGVPGSHVLTP